MTILYISMNGDLVGELVRDSAGKLFFKYDRHWLEQAAARPISLSMPLTDLRYHGAVVYNFFDNLLPDNSRIRDRIQAVFRVKTSQPFDLLAAIGKDCVGAIQLSEEPPSFDKKIEAEYLSDTELADLLRNFKNAPLGMKNNTDDFRISIAGAQEKSAFLAYLNS